MRVSLALTVSLFLVVNAALPPAPAAVSAGGTGWVWANPLPQGGDLDAIALTAASPPAPMA